MYDIHSHVIYDLEKDTAQLEESLKTCRAAVKSGIKGIIVTPRYIDGDCSITPAMIIDRIRQFNSKISDMGWDIMLYPGMEVQAVPDIVRLYDDRKILALNCKRYMLISLPEDEDMPVFLNNMIFDLEIRGIRPVIVHPERCRAVERDPGLVTELIDRDCIIQMDSGSIGGLHGRNVMKLAALLLKRNMVHIISSNHHSGVPSTYGLYNCYNTVYKKYGRELASALFIDNPYRIICGQDIQITDPHL